MKIVVCHTRRYGGVTSFLLNLITNYEFTQEDILLLNQNIDEKILEQIKQITKCRVLLLTSRGMNTLSTRWLQAIQIIKLVKKYKPEKIIYADWHMILDGISVIANVKQVNFVHTYPTKQLPFYLREIINKFLRNVSIVTVSNSSKKIIEDNWLIDSNKISILYNYSNLSGNFIIPKLDNNDINIVTIAHCEDYKNPNLWLKTANMVTQHNSNIKFHWYGDGNLYEIYSKKTENDNNIFFHGYSDKISEILNSKTNIYFQCSSIESLGISILDAMNYSVPTVVANVGGMPELVINGKTGFIGTTEEEFYDYFLEIVSSKEQFESFSQSAKYNYEKNFSKSIWVKKIADILQ